MPCQASKTAFRSHCARPTGRYGAPRCVSEASCPNFEPRAHARLTGLTTQCQAKEFAFSKTSRWPRAGRGRLGNVWQLDHLYQTFVGLQPTVIASRASPPLLEQSSSTVGRKRMRVVQKSERVFYWSRKNAHVIGNHGHEAPRVREISAPTSTRETNKTLGTGARLLETTF